MNEIRSKANKCMYRHLWGVKKKCTRGRRSYYMIKRAVYFCEKKKKLISPFKKKDINDSFCETISMKHPLGK